jgi:hydroxyacid-oxoacid transhydrogenase
MSVILNAPAVFRFTADANLDRHGHAATIMGQVVENQANAGKLLAKAIIELMKQLDMPNGLSAVGYSEKDVPVLVKNTLPQQRVIGLSPKPVGEKELELLFSESMRLW